MSWIASQYIWKKCKSVGCEFLDFGFLLNCWCCYAEIHFISFFIFIIDAVCIILMVRYAVYWSVCRLCAQTIKSLILVKNENISLYQCSQQHSFTYFRIQWVPGALSVQVKWSGLAPLNCSICHSAHSAQLIWIFVLLLEIVVSFSSEFFLLLDWTMYSLLGKQPSHMCHCHVERVWNWVLRKKETSGLLRRLPLDKRC